MNSLSQLASTLTLATILGLPGLASAHPGHDPFDSIPEKKVQKGEAGTEANGPVIFSSIQDIEQTSSMEIWAGLRFKAYYHLTITGKRNNNQEDVKRTFTFEVANDTKDRKRAGRGYRAKGAIAAKTYARKITACRNLAAKAMTAPEQYDLRVENRGRKSSACRLINRNKPTPAVQPNVNAQPEIAKRAVKTRRGSV
jgi:uncharacterized protein (DUF608 family)